MDATRVDDYEMSRACRNGQVDRVRELLLLGVSVSMEHAELALSWVHCLALLLDHRPQLVHERWWCQADEMGDTLLHMAIRDRHRSPQAIPLLLARGADISALGFGGYTATGLAVDRLDVAALPPLLSAGGRLQEWVHYGVRALPVAITRLQTRIARCRLAQRAVQCSGRVHKDVMPMVWAFLWAQRFNEAWDTESSSNGSTDRLKRARVKE